MSPTGATSTITLDDGRPAFRKALADAPPGFFTFEAAGLTALRELGARVPEVYEVTDDHLVLELVQAVPGAQRVADTETAFGQDLARLHLNGAQAAAPQQHFGSLEGVHHWYLGGAAIDLSPASSLYESLVVNRVRPLTDRAIAAGLLKPAAGELVSAITPQHLGPEETPVVVHGDLWAGNRMIDEAGVSWMIDPSCHWGHREEDIAMMQLFGGFGPAVVQAYDQVFPLAAGWRQRVPVFQLVPLLVHVLLFGTGYAGPTMRALRATAEAEEAP